MEDIMADFSVSVSKDGGVSIVKVVGDLDAHVSPEFHKKLEAEVKANPKIVLDFSALNYICSAGMGILTASQGLAQKSGGDIILVGLNDEVKQVFETMGFLQIFNIANSVSEAKASL